MASSKVCFGGGFGGFFLILPRPKASIGFMGSGLGGRMGMLVFLSEHHESTFARTYFAVRAMMVAVAVFFMLILRWANDPLTRMFRTASASFI